MTQPKIKFIKNDNTDRQFPDAFEITSAEFKVNGEYVCAEPCGSGGSAEHLLGDVHIYVDINGSDAVYDIQGQLRTGSMNDPFATIQRAIDYMNSIVTIEGRIFINLGIGNFYISDVIRINHTNELIIIGRETFLNNILISDTTSSFFKYIWYGGDALIAGGEGTGIEYHIERIQINVPSNSHNFANLTRSRSILSGCSDGTTGIWAGGTTLLDSMDYSTIAIQADATISPGILTDGRHWHYSVSDGVTGVIAGGRVTIINGTDLIERINIASLSNGTIYGNLVSPTVGLAGCSNKVYGVFDAGSAGSRDDIWWFFIAVGGISEEWGTLTYTGYSRSACSSDTVGIWAGGFLGRNEINRIYTAAKSNPTNFGILSSGRTYPTSVSDNIYAVIAGGSFDGIYLDTIDYVTIDILSDATNFGNLVGGRNNASGVSGR